MRLFIVGLFCEDIREEKAGTDTLVGILPDRVNVPSFPGGFPRLAAFIRLNFDPTYELQDLHLFMEQIGGETIDLGPIEEQIIEKARAEAKKNNSPLAGIISKIKIDFLQIPHPGMIKLLARIDHQTFVFATLTLVLAENQNNSTT